MFEFLPLPSLVPLLIAFGIDRLLGELPSALHPVVWLGHAVTWAAGKMPRRPRGIALFGGTVIALGIPLLATAAAYSSQWLWSLVPSELLGWVLEGVVLSTTFAVKMLGDAVLSVRNALQQGSLADARHALRSLCSRDSGALDTGQVSGAAIESVAENASDSFVAPLFYYCLLGLPGAMTYRAINTLDAMLGYRGELEYLGKASARLDDLANLVPSRLTAGLLLIASLGRRSGPGLRVWWKDARTTESPNAGHPMAMMSGLLGVCLEKEGAYTLGRRLRAPQAEDITRAWTIVSVASWLLLLLCCLYLEWLR